MTPQAARSYVESREIFGMRFGVERMHAVLSELGDPQRCAPAIHVVGTNGKSSTCRFAAAALSSQGLRVGTYTSPHIVDWAERIVIDGAPIDEEAFARAVTSVAAAADRCAECEGAITQFEVLTAAAFVAFADAAVDIMVVEAGLGGRYDATNVFDGAAVVALTNIAREHTELLGETEREIAEEKLAVVPDGGDQLVVGALSLPAVGAVAHVCARRRLRPWLMGREITIATRGGRADVGTPHGTYHALATASPGAFQIDNLAVGLAAAERRLGTPLDPERLVPALAEVRVAGRLEVVSGPPLLVMDGAHNLAGMQALTGSLASVVGTRPLIGVISILGDKDLNAMIAALAPSCAHIIATRSRHARAVSPEQIAGVVRSHGSSAEAIENPMVALDRARARAGLDGAVLVCGSLYLLTDIRTRALRMWSERPGIFAAESRRKSP